jgi:hypothetical protein
MIDADTFTAIEYNGDWVIPVPVDASISFYFYLFPNPVTPVSEIIEKEYQADKEEIIRDFFDEILYVKTEFLNIEGDNKLKDGDEIEITVAGKTIEGYFFGDPPGSSNPIISFKPPLADEDLGIPVTEDGFYKEAVVLIRTEEVITRSKQEYKYESVNYVESGGVRVELEIGESTYHLARMPNDFLIQKAYQPGNDNPKPEFWSLTEEPFIPLRASESDVRDNGDFGQVEVPFNWAENILILLNQKY